MLARSGASPPFQAMLYWSGRTVRWGAMARRRYRTTLLYPRLDTAIWKGAS